MQSAHTLKWARTLRSRSPSPSNGQGRTPSGVLKATGARSSSTNGALLSRSAEKAFSARNGSIRNSTESAGQPLATANDDYIAALQQQVHFLELDVGRLREQAQAATELHPQMTAEAEKMLVKLREQQTSADDLALQLQRVEAEIAQVTAERNILATRLESEISLRAKDRHMLANEVLLARKGKEDAALAGVRKDSQLREALDKNEETRLVLRQIEEKNVELATLLDQRAEQHCLALIALEEKGAHLALVSGHLSDTKRRYSESTAVSRDKTVSKLKAEVQLLRRALGIHTASVVTTPPDLTKQGMRALTLHEENDVLKQRVTELKTRLTMENNRRNSMASQLEEETAEVARLYARTKALSLQLQQSTSLSRHTGRSDSDLRNNSDNQRAVIDRSALELNGEKTAKAAPRQSADAQPSLKIPEVDSKQSPSGIAAEKRNFGQGDQQLSKSNDLDVGPSSARGNSEKNQNDAGEQQSKPKLRFDEPGQSQLATAAAGAPRATTHEAKTSTAQPAGLLSEADSTRSAAEDSFNVTDAGALNGINNGKQLDMNGLHKQEGESEHLVVTVNGSADLAGWHVGQAEVSSTKSIAETLRKSVGQREEPKVAAGSRPPGVTVDGNSYTQVQMPAIDVRVDVVAPPIPTDESRKPSASGGAQSEVAEARNYRETQATVKEQRKSVSQALGDDKQQAEPIRSQAQEQQRMPWADRGTAQPTARRRSLNDDLALVRQQQQHRTEATNGHQQQQPTTAVAAAAAV